MQTTEFADFPPFWISRNHFPPDIVRTYAILLDTMHAFRHIVIQSRETRATA